MLVSSRLGLLRGLFQVLLEHHLATKEKKLYEVLDDCKEESGRRSEYQQY